LSLPERIRFTVMAVQKYTDRRRPKILFVYNTMLWYMRPFFIRLSEIYDIKFIFTNMQLDKRIYGVETPEGDERFAGMKYKVLKRYLANIYRSGIPLGLIKELFQEHYDIVFTSLSSVEMLLGFLAAKSRGKQVILTSGEWGWQGKSSERTLAAFFNKLIVPRCDAIAVPGTKHREYFVSLGASPNRVFIMPYASNISIKEEDYQEAEQLIERLGIGTKKVILYVGRLIKQKGVNYLIEAFSKLREERDDVILIIVGEGESRSELELLSENLNIEDSVYFTGFVANVKLPAYYLVCDICAIPSITYGKADVWVRAVNDAMCAMKPVIATDAVGAAFDMIKDGENGFVVPEKDAGALFEAIEKVISNLELAKRMGEESKRIIEQGFTYKHMIKGFSKAVESISKETKSE